MEKTLSDIVQPKVFISYSWSSPSHEAWVLKLAEDLAESGIHPILDKWDLREGEDSALFMERMVNDAEITKVMLICDRKYKEKADSRTGGAGTEAQIISPELYGSATNTKFCAVLAEKDDKEQGFVPTYYRGRIYIDLSEESQRSDKFEQLTRWIYDKPLNVRPPIGNRPAFLDEDTSSLQLHTSVAARRAIDAVRNHKTFWPSAIKEYFEFLSTDFGQLRLPYKPDYEELVLESIESFLPYRNQFIDVCKTCAAEGSSLDCSMLIHRFFESLIPYFSPPTNTNLWRPCETDNYKFLIYELFMYAGAIFLNQERFDVLATLFQQGYFGRDHGLDSQERLNNFTLFGSHSPETFDIINRQQSSRKHSYRAYILNERVSGTGFEYRDLMHVDLIMAFAAHSQKDAFRLWWPDTLLYSSRQGVFPVFARSQSKLYFSRVSPALGLSAEEVVEVATDVDKGGGLFGGFGASISLKRMIDSENFCIKQ